mgnify:CR=1 FL=1
MAFCQIISSAGTIWLRLVLGHVLLELLIDPACSVVFEAEPQDPELMTRPPRPAADSPFSWRAASLGVSQGLGVGGILLVGQWYLSQQGWTETQSRSVVFSALVLSVMLLILGNRHADQPLWRGLLRRDRLNPWLLRMAAGVAVLLVTVQGLPWLQRLMGLDWPGTLGAGAVVLLLLVCSLWIEAVRRGTAYAIK